MTILDLTKKVNKIINYQARYDGIEQNYVPQNKVQNNEAEQRKFAPYELFIADMELEPNTRPKSDKPINNHEGLIEFIASLNGFN